MKIDTSISQESNAIFDDSAVLAFRVGSPNADGMRRLGIYGNPHAFVKAALSMPSDKIRDLRDALLRLLLMLNEEKDAQ